MAYYAQKDADIANKTLFYPLIDDISDANKKIIQHAENKYKVDLS